MTGAAATVPSARNTPSSYGAMIGWTSGPMARPKRRYPVAPVEHLRDPMPHAAACDPVYYRRRYGAARHLGSALMT